MKTALMLMLSVNFSLAAAAGMPTASRDEIDHLLAYVDRSNCRFYRNGTWHNADEARSHLGRKFTYLAGKGSIQTAEDFIAKAASASSISRQPYLVSCDSEAQIPSARWLGDELARYRVGAAQSRVNDRHE
jgi:hypothetical protein